MALFHAIYAEERKLNFVTVFVSLRLRLNKSYAKLGGCITKAFSFCFFFTYQLKVFDFLF